MFTLFSYSRKIEEELQNIEWVGERKDGCKRKEMDGEDKAEMAQNKSSL